MDEVKNQEFFNGVMLVNNMIEQMQKKNGGIVFEPDVISLAEKEGMKEEDIKESLSTLKASGDVIDVGDGFIKSVG